MRALVPADLGAGDALDAYALPAAELPGRPFVRVNMISSLDGAIAIHGRAGGLTGPADQRLFQLLRSLTDVVVVGAGTMRTEGYGPVRLDAAQRAQRQARGQSPVPPIAVVTHSCHLDWTAPFFSEAEARPILLTTGDADDQAVARASDAADVIVCGDTQVDLSRALGELGRRGTHSVLVEGGPTLNAQLAAAGLIDELCLTLSPRLVAGTGPRVLAGPELNDALALDVRHIMEEDGFFFLRLCLPPGGPPRPDPSPAGLMPTELMEET
jgi:riboflavin-specific deaminase-like protein